MTSETSRAMFSDQIADICEQMGVAPHDAFPRWICQTILGIAEEGSIDEAISIGGSNDYGVDVFHADVDSDDTDQYVCWIQAKYSEGLDHIVTREELDSFAGTLYSMRNCPEPANHTFKQKSREFASMEKRYPGIKKKMIFVAAGRLNAQAESLTRDQKWLEDKFGSEYGTTLDFEVYDLDKILSYMIMPHTPNLRIKFDGGTIRRTDEKTSKETVTGYGRIVAGRHSSKAPRHGVFGES